MKKPTFSQPPETNVDPQAPSTSVPPSRIVQSHPERLEDLSGVGRTLADRIRAAYGSDQAFFDACDALDLEPLFSVDGLSERRAFELAGRVRSGREPPLAADGRADAIRRRLQDLLAGYARTDYGRHSLRLLPVLRDADRIAEQADRVMRARATVESLDRDAVGRHLGRLAPLKDGGRPAGLNRMVVCDDEEAEFRLREAGVDRWCRIASGRAAVAYLDDYELVVYARSDGSLGVDTAANVVTVPLADAPDAAVPERDVAFVKANRTALEAMAELARLTDQASVAPRILESIDEAASTRRVDVRKAAEEALAKAEEVFETRVEELSLNGNEVLDLLARGTPASLQSVRRDAVAAGRAHFESALGCPADPFAPGLPVQIDDEEVLRLEREVAGRRAAQAFESAQAAARVVHENRDAVREELRSWFRFDVDFALGSYAADFDAHPARTGPAFRFQGGANVEVARRADVQRIDYDVGGDHRLAVLTGANSGGKTTLLEQCAQFTILHHWGLPVPAAEATVPILDRVLLFAGGRSLDAGAFESFLGGLFPALVEPGRKLILLDEVESVTELEAAGRILGVFLEQVAQTDSLCVLVTHLPDEVLKHARVAVRVDGIDAVGLDDDFNLLVDRQPKTDHRARSTPELILRRVHARSEGALKDVYGRVLARWS